MHTITFIPSICKASGDIPAEYSGEVVLRAPTHGERTSFYDLESIIEDVDLDDLKKNHGSLDDKAKMVLARKNYVRMKERVTQALPKFIVSVNILRLEDGHNMTFDDINHDSDCGSIIEEMAANLIGKFRVGKNTPTS